MCQSFVWNMANIVTLSAWATTQGTLSNMNIRSSWLIVGRQLGDVIAQWYAAWRHAMVQFGVLTCRIVGTTKQNPLGMADIWTVTEDVAFGCALCSSSVVHGSIEPKEEVAMVWIVNTGSMLSGGQWCTSCRSGPKRPSGKERGPMTPPGKHLRTQQPLKLLDYQYPVGIRHPLDTQDPQNHWDLWFWPLPFAHTWSIPSPLVIVLLRLIPLPQPILLFWSIWLPWLLWLLFFALSSL